MKKNICKKCGGTFYHEYGQVMCRPCLKEMGNEMWKNGVLREGHWEGSTFVGEDETLSKDNI